MFRISSPPSDDSDQIWKTFASEFVLPPENDAILTFVSPSSQTSNPPILAGGGFIGEQMMGEAEPTFHAIEIGDFGGGGTTPDPGGDSSGPQITWIGSALPPPDEPENNSTPSIGNIFADWHIV